MGEYVISCCSSIDMDEAWAKERQVNVLFHNIFVGQDEYPDNFGRSISTHEIYTRMLAGELTKTSQVNIEDYETSFRKILSEGKDVLHVTLSSGISGTYNSAKLAASDLQEEFPDRKIYIVDSLCASSGYGMLVDDLCDLRDAGKSIDEVREYAEKEKKHIQHWFFVPSLKFLILGGRVSKAAGMIGSVLNIVPLMDVAPDGTLKVIEKIRGKKKVIERDVEMMEKYAEHGTDYDGKCFITEAENMEDAEKLLNLIEQRFPKLQGKVRICHLGPTIACHTGPGVIVLLYHGKDRV
jgi:DegV family protein with EDD domain